MTTWARSLKSLRLISCSEISLLEELELSECSGIGGNESIVAIAKSCPQLNHFRLIRSKSSYPFTEDNDDGEALAISGMHGPRSLELYHNGLTNNGLMTILDNCVHLELLIIRECPNVTMDDALLAKCARVMIVTLRGDGYAYYKYNARGSYAYYRGWHWYSEQCPTCDLFRVIRDMDDDYWYYEEVRDYGDYSRYLNGVYVTDLDDEEHSRIVAKRARRYLKINTEV
ncbi:hypothetical protein C2845_PM04G10950 [Panicum miliaceum]|uniref:F-box/LRR-repeat protein 23 n=1 Tax=Panicum miliaceum TaxID=4540 RepID=A0A3L6QVB3_PANMI|nr:hypothetical protein C2845_PM04G10950 [Panicum miliaceum]